jgi:predicted nucleotidyltransferase
MLDDAKHLTDSEKSALAEIKRRVSGLFDVRQYVLFGSKARGDAEPDSDIDLLIVTKRPLSWKEKERITHEMLDVNLVYDTNYAGTVVDAETWNSALWRIVPLHRNVTREGIVV